MRRLRQELAPSNYLPKATCITLGVELNFDATQQNAERNQLAAALCEATSRRLHIEYLRFAFCGKSHGRRQNLT